MHKQILLIRLLTRVLTFTFLVTNILIGSNVKYAEAHSANLNVFYDDPATATNAWYYLIDYTNNNFMDHIYKASVTYCVADETDDPDCPTDPTKSDWYWLSYCNSTTEVDIIKRDFVNSMCKWNNYYILKRNSDNTKTASRLVSITSTSYSNANVVVYPYSSNSSFGCESFGIFPREEIDSDHEKYNIWHRHYDRAWLGVAVNKFSNWMNNYPNKYAVIKEAVGAHEFGHVLGLLDIDKIEHGDNSYQWHNNDKIMGYGTAGNILTYQTEVSYYDLMGAAITQGIHTDNDHEWRLVNTDSNGNSTIICYLCNGKRIVTLDSDGMYNGEVVLTPKTFGCSDACHTRSRLDLVGYHGDLDIHKCSYCDYYEEFSHQFPGTWTKDNIGHRYVCQDCKRTYSEAHNCTYYDGKYHCSTCGWSGKFYVGGLNSEGGTVTFAFDPGKEYSIEEAANVISTTKALTIREKLEMIEEINAVETAISNEKTKVQMAYVE